MRCIIISLLLCFGMGARAGNVVTIGTASGAPDDEVTVSIGLENSDAVSSLQVNIPLDERLSFVAGSAVLSSRSNGHSVTAGVKDGELNIMVYSLGLAALMGSDGEVVSFRLKLGNQPSDIALTASKLILGDTGGNTIEGATATNGSVSIRCAKAQYSTMTVDFGGVPIRSTYHQTVTVTNIGNEPLEVTGLQFNTYPTYFSSETVFPFTVAASSNASIDITYAPQERGTVSETVKVLCNSISKLNNITLQAEPFAVNELHLQPAEGYSDETVTVAMTMNNMDAISGFQFEFNLPDALEYVPNSFVLSGRKQDHAVVATVTNGVLRIVAYSPTDQPFTGEDGELATMQFVLRGRNSVTLKASKSLLTATVGGLVTNVCSADYGATITIRSPQISANGTLDMGRTPVTGDAVSHFDIYNYGNAPLVISRVLFDNEDFYIRESLPLTINSYGNKTLTVVYPSTEEGDYQTTMQIYSNDPEQRLWSVNVTGNRFAPNYFEISTENVSAFDNLNIEVSVNAFDPIAGLQFDLVYPGSCYEPFSNNYTLEPRAEGMTVTYRQIDDNTLRFFCYFLTGEGIAAGDGKAMTLRLRPKGEHALGGNYTLKATNIKLGTSGMADKYAGEDCEVSFTVFYPVTSISVSPTSLTLEGGEVVQLTASVNADATNQNIVWSSSDTSIATVNAVGRVMGKRKGTATITVASEENPNIQATCEVEVISEPTGAVLLPDAPFEFYYNAIDYDAESHSIPNHPQANLADASLVLSNNIPEFVDDERLRINNSCWGYIDRWAKTSTESGQHFYRSGEDCMTIVCKVSSNFGSGSNASDFICNRGGGYNYMLRIGDHGKLFLHTGTAYSGSRSLPIEANEPQILAVRVDGKNDHILLQNLTTGESLQVNGVNWGGSNNVFRLFCSDSPDVEWFAGDFYWMYYSFEYLTDEQLEVFTKNFLLGDVNGDGVVDISDYISEANYIHGNIADGFVFKAGDIDGSGGIDITDYIGISNIIHTGSPYGQSQTEAKAAVPFKEHVPE